MIPENYVPKLGDVVITKGYCTEYDGKPLTIRTIGQRADNKYCYFKESAGLSHNFLSSDIIEVMSRRGEKQKTIQSSEFNSCMIPNTEGTKFEIAEEPVAEKLLKTDDVLKGMTEPLMRYLRENYHPHVKLIIDSDKAELMEGIFLNTNKYGSRTR